MSSCQKCKNVSYNRHQKIYYSNSIDDPVASYDTPTKSVVEWTTDTLASIQPLLQSPACTQELIALAQSIVNLIAMLFSLNFSANEEIQSKVYCTFDCFPLTVYTVDPSDARTCRDNLTTNRQQRHTAGSTPALDRTVHQDNATRRERCYWLSDRHRPVYCPDF